MHNPATSGDLTQQRALVTSATRGIAYTHTTLCYDIHGYIPVGVGVLKHSLVVLRQGCDVDDRGHVVEAVDPLLSLVALPPNVVHLERRALDLVLVHHDPCRSKPHGANDVKVDINLAPTPRKLRLCRLFVPPRESYHR